jgi:hypothetical protein
VRLVSLGLTNSGMRILFVEQFNRRKRNLLIKICFFFSLQYSIKYADRRLMVSFSCLSVRPSFRLSVRNLQLENRNPNRCDFWWVSRSRRKRKKNGPNQVWGSNGSRVMGVQPFCIGIKWKKKINSLLTGYFFAYSNHSIKRIHIPEFI